MRNVLISVLDYFLKKRTQLRRISMTKKLFKLKVDRCVSLLVLLLRKKQAMSINNNMILMMILIKHLLFLMMQTCKSKISLRQEKMMKMMIWCFKQNLPHQPLRIDRELLWNLILNRNQGTLEGNNIPLLMKLQMRTTMKVVRERLLHLPKARKIKNNCSPIRWIKSLWIHRNSLAKTLSGEHHS